MPSAKDHGAKGMKTDHNLPRRAAIRRTVPAAFALHLAIATLFGQSIDIAGAAEGKQTAGLERFALQAPATLPGQSATLLPDGRWLFVGGTQSGAPGSAIYTTDATSTASSSATPSRSLGSLVHPRQAHTATVLPDGTVLIVGGVGLNGATVAAAEILDPISGEITVIDDSGLSLRSHHAATLLTDGYVLISGGVSPEGKALQDAELWNPDTHRIEPISNPLMVPRADHSAALLPDGKGLIWGGQDAAGQSLTGGETYDPAQTRFTPVDPSGLPPAYLRDAPPAIEASLPKPDATDAPVDGRIAIRFSKSLQVRSVTAKTVTLVGPAGSVPGKVVAAGDGMLVFFTPQTDLLHDTTYTVFLRGLTDAPGQALPWSAFRFTTKSLKPAPTTTAAGAGGGTAGVSAPVAAATTNPTVTPSAAEQEQDEKQRKRKPGAKEEEKKAPAQDADFEDWIPGEHHRHGEWRVLGTTNEPRTNKVLARIAPMQAAAKATALAGRVVKLNGLPLEGVLVRAGNASTLTDAQGRFLLSGLRAGVHAIKVDGSGVASGDRRYATHFLRVELAPRRTTTLDAPIYLSRLNPANDVSIPSPADKDLVLTHPDIPGLELHIPKGSVLRTRDGKIVTKLNITPLPVDRVPFAVPEGFPVYFTIQPAGAFIDNSATGQVTGIRVIYPNYLGAPADTRVVFWNYDPTGLGWQIYGRGTVSKDGSKVVPDDDVTQRDLMAFGYGIDNVGNAPPVGPSCEKEAQAGDPVDCSTGLFLHNGTDLYISDTIPLSVQRAYRTNDVKSREFGIGANHNYAMFLSNPTGNPSSFPPIVDLILADGRRVAFGRMSGSGLGDAVYQHWGSPSAWLGATLRINAPADQWEITTRDKTIYSFSAHNPNILVGIRDRYGNAITITRVGEAGNIRQVRSPNGRSLTFEYDTANRITRIRDNLGRIVRYEYDNQGRLWKVTDPNGKVERYEYDNAHRMTAVIDRRGNTMVTNVYDTNGRVSQQTLADGAVWGFSYTLNSAGKVTQTDVTNPRGYVTQMKFNGNGYLTQVTRALGQPEQQTYSYVRDDQSNLRLSITDPLNRVTQIGYDYLGNTSSVTRLFGTANAVRATYEYDPVFSSLIAFTDPLGHATRFNYDAIGNLIGVTDPLSQTTAIAYDDRGRAVSITNALGKTTQIGYEQAEIASVTDPLGRTTSIFSDGVGRTIGIGDPAGNRGRLEYDSLDRVQRSIDPHGAVTAITYDENDNMRTVRDARDLAAHSYTYDVRDRVETYTDPLGKSESYAYDEIGNVLSVVDRKGQTTSYTYDALNRLKTVTHADGSVITLVWDAGNRPRTVIDSANGTITLDYDDLDRLIRETSPQGQVEYQYDDAGRRTQLTVAGQAPITYDYNDANRLTQIAQGSVTVEFTYDAANRRATVTLPNGIVGSYSFDDANQLLSILYDRGATRIADITYAYDAAGRRIGQSGSLAGMLMPGTVNSADYDAANRLTTWGATTLSYDDNGNVTRLGMATYGWNAREQLISSTDGAGTFAYDPVGRRVAKTVAGSAVTYLHDGMNPVAINGNLLLSGLALDEMYAMIGPDGVTSRLSDGIGSTRLLTKEDASSTASFAYTPYGQASRSGGAGDSLFRFTGREDDGASGLYYYRARYYSPTLGRFVQSDPIGLAGGINTYAYVGGDPVSLIDPFGLDIMDPVWGAVYDNTGWTPAQSSVDFWAGMGDSASFGLTNWMRDLHGTNGEVNKCSGGYMGGTAAAALMTPIGRIGYMVRAAQIPKLAQSGRQAVSMRNMLRYQYRGPLTRIPFFANWHMRTYLSFIARGRTEAQIIQNAGNVSRGWSAGMLVGVPAASGVLASFRMGECGCD
jgi:RHS repeat-associated protein